MIIGNLGSQQRAEVGSGGVVQLAGGVRIEWWVKAGERWQAPATEISVRDQLLAFAPVLKTSVRVPGGDVIVSVYATVQGQRELVAFDLTNQSSAPVAIGFIVRPRPGSSDLVTLDGTTVRVGSRPVLFLPSIPVDRLVDGPTTGELFVLPLIHRSSLRSAALLGVSSAVAAASTPVLSALPDPDMVARGWALQAGEAARIDGDDALHGRLRSLASGVLLYSDTIRDNPNTPLVDRVAMARGLAAIGAHDDAVSFLSGLDNLQGRRGEFANDEQRTAQTTAAVVTAVVAVGRSHPNPTFAHASVPLLSGALEWLHRAVKTDAALVEAHSGVFLAASRLFERVGEHRAAKNSFDAWERLGRVWPLARIAEPGLPALSSGASLLPPDLPRTVNATMDVVDGLVTEQIDGSLDVFGGWTTADLLGRRIAVHDADSPFGKVSVAIRWHGARPAVLWDIAAAPADQVKLTCSTLDPSWSTAEHRGEALLAAPAVDR